MPVAAGTWPGPRDGRVDDEMWDWGGRLEPLGKGRAVGGGRERWGAKEAEAADPGGDPTGALILSTVAKGLVVSGLIRRRGRFR